MTITLTNIGDNFYERVIRINTDIEMMANNNFDSSLGKRYLWLQSGFNNIKSKPIFGYGVGSYKSKINEYISSNNINIDSSLVVTNNPHNEFVSLSSQIGLFGLLFFIMFLISLFKKRENNFIVYGVFTTVVISSLFNSAFYDNILGIFLIIIISLSFQKVK
jgi:O-antigen ligase